MLAAALVLACNGSPVVSSEGGGFRHPTLGYSVGPPGLTMQRIRVDDTDLAFRDTAGTSWSVLSQCGRATARPAILARHLTIGLGERQLQQAGPVQHAGLEGWSQVVDVLADAIPLRLTTVTLVQGRCTFDFIQSARRDTVVDVEAFERWWRSFSPGPERPVEGDA